MYIREVLCWSGDSSSAPSAFVALFLLHTYALLCAALLSAHTGHELHRARGEHGRKSRASLLPRVTSSISEAPAWTSPLVAALALPLSLECWSLGSAQVSLPQAPFPFSGVKPFFVKTREDVTSGPWKLRAYGCGVLSYSVKDPCETLQSYLFTKNHTKFTCFHFNIVCYR
jgi:hypothetical protein